MPQAEVSLRMLSFSAMWTSVHGVPRPQMHRQLQSMQVQCQRQRQPARLQMRRSPQMRKMWARAMLHCRTGCLPVQNPRRMRPRLLLPRRW